MAPLTTRRAPSAEAWAIVQELLAGSRGHFLDVTRKFDLSPPQLFALRALKTGAPTPMGELAGVLHCDNSNITGIVDRLERRGLVERQAAAHDRRVKHLVITPQGIKVRDDIATALEAGPNPLASLTDDDATALLHLLQKAAAAQA